MRDLPAYEKTRGLSMRDKAGQLFMPAAYINDTEEKVRALETLIRNGQAGGICFFHSRASAAANFEGPQKVRFYPDSLKRLKELIRRYQEAATFPLLVAMDAEWGLAMRVENTPRYPYAGTLGALKEASEELIYQVGLCIARDCREAGIHWNFAPVVDINTNPENPVIGYRAFGTGAGSVLRKARQMFRGLEDGGVLSCLKHFPGHGDTAVDSHLQLPVVRKNLETLNDSELIPFRELILEGAPTVMTGHLALPGLDPSGLPASLSRVIIDLLREDLGFDGVVITDALNMHALRNAGASPSEINLKAYQAGNDMLCFADQVPESIDRILDHTSSDRLEDSFRRIWKLKERVFHPKMSPKDPKIPREELGRRLGPLCLSETGDLSQALASFRKEGFGVAFHGNKPGVFLEGLEEIGAGQATSWEPGQDLPDTQNLVLALVPPSMKPAENFGLRPSFLEAVGSLASKRRVILYLFGSPYLLRKLPTELFFGVVCAYQPLDAMQEAAAGHLLGKTKADGQLYIDLNHG